MYYMNYSVLGLQIIVHSFISKLDGGNDGPTQVG